MPRIAAHHANDPWRPILLWPETAYVQWGGRGVVFTEDGGYDTAFFEAFPDKDSGAGGFLRGEGKTLEEAEANCFRRYERQRACFEAGGHRWTRARRLKPRGDGSDPRPRRGQATRVRVYSNGGCFCLRCGAFETVMPPIVPLGAWRAPLAIHELEAMASGGVRPAAWETTDDPKRWEKYRRRLALRAKLHGIELPDWRRPEHQGPAPGPFADDPYQAACREAVLRHYADQYQRLRAQADAHGISMDGFFQGVAVRLFHREAVERGLLPADAPHP